MPITGHPYLTARSITLQTFSANTSDNEPPKTVKSCEKTNTLRSNTVPYPVTTASPHGRFSAMPNSVSRCRTKRSSSTNEPGSSSFSSRSRAWSLPRSRCRSTALSEAARAASSRSSASQRSLSSVVSWRLDIEPEPNRSHPSREPFLATSARDMSCGWLPGRRPPPHGSSLSPNPAQMVHGSAPDSHRAFHRRATSSVPAVDARLDRSTTWPYDDGEPGPFSYARDNHPTGVACEQALGALDGGRALLFPSGMGAVTTVLLTLAAPGRTIAIAEAAYYGHAQLVRHLEPWQLRLVEFDQTAPPPPDADLVLIEAPANPMLTMPDFEAAVAHPATVVCDATVASPLRVRPLELGCDIVVHSATKVLAGHDDVLAGVAVARDDEVYERLHMMRRRTGIVAAPDVAWLLQRGLRTLAVRLERQERTARRLAEQLSAHPAVQIVRYPGFSFLVSFDVADSDAAGRVERAVRVIENATSLGAVRSKLESRHRWEGDRIPSGLLRLSVGLEDPDDLWSDLEQALAHA